MQILLRGGDMKIKESMRKEKTEFVKKMGEMLKIDPRSELKLIVYKVEEQWDWYEEYVEMMFTSGVVKKIKVTGNSDYAILNDVMKAVYG